ncbi:hypothetical protein NE237_013569 [Protea cynaroides]|uniref:Phytocyanin domain-containing protein n=1 Tax=Protea cynaroides TaxID=273540 RepID=A0A9Q0H179_9MAGN|nr:hypothetical protein NE237_013569 [Protea cynaroides]
MAQAKSGRVSQAVTLRIVILFLLLKWGTGGVLIQKFSVGPKKRISRLEYVRSVVLKLCLKMTQAITRRVSQAATLGIVILFLLLKWEIVLCNNTYVVGYAKGWGPYPEIFYWTKGKDFKTGDTLVFNYQNPDYRVAVVNADEYTSCIAGPDAKIYNSGHDQIQIGPQNNFYIAAVPQYCNEGAKLQVYGDF